MFSWHSRDAEMWCGEGGDARGSSFVTCECEQCIPTLKCSFRQFHDVCLFTAAVFVLVGASHRHSSSFAALLPGWLHALT